MIKQRTLKTQVSNILLIEEDDILVELHFVESSVNFNDESVVLDNVEKQLKEYFNKKREVFDLPMNLKGTTFQKEVWQAMREIPYGETRSYQEIAQMIDRPKACRAVGNACNKNPIAIIVPCHRVVASNHKLGGFAFGLDCKIGLLEIENIKY